MHVNSLLQSPLFHLPIVTSSQTPATYRMINLELEERYKEIIGKRKKDHLVTIISSFNSINVRSHIGWREKRSIFYKDVKVSS